MGGGFSRRSLWRSLAPLGAAMVMVFPAHVDHALVPAPQATPPSIPSGAVLRSDRVYKMGMVEELKEPPRLLIFGGSRATRFDPALFRRLTGLPTFNFAFSNGRPTDHWALSRWYLSRHPGLKVHLFWAVEPSLFFQKDLDPGLVQDARLSSAFTQRVIDTAARKQVAAMGVDRVLLCAGGSYRDDGLLPWGWYDVRESQGMTLDRAVRQWVASVTWRTKSKLNSVYRAPVWSLNKICFAETMGLFNSIGVTPVIVVMPTQPLAIQLLGEQHWHDGVMRFLASLRAMQRRYRFSILDYSRVEDFGGDPSAFYDGVHVKAKNATLITEHAIKDAPEGFR